MIEFGLFIYTQLPPQERDRLGFPICRVNTTKMVSLAKEGGKRVSKVMKSPHGARVSEAPRVNSGDLLS